jgi:hypothetical protein
MKIAVAAAFVVATVPGIAEGVAVPAGTYVYVHDRTTDARVHGYSLSKEGVLALLPGSPFDDPADGGGCGGYCETMAYSAKRKMLFTGSEADGMGAFNVLPGGALEAVAGSPFGGAGGLWGTGVVQRGRRTFVYGCAYQTDQVRGFEVQDDGTLVELPSSPFAAGDGPDGLAAVKNKVFVANEGARTISSYVVAPDGSLVSSGDPVDVAGVDFIYNVNPDSTGKVLYVAGCDQTVAIFRVDPRTAALTPLEDSPFDSVVPDACVGAAVSKKLLAVPSNNNGPAANLQVFRRGKEGVPTALGTPQDTGIDGAECCAFDRTGRLFVVVNDTQVQSVVIDPRTGGATAGTPVAAPSNSPTCLVVVKR